MPFTIFHLPFVESITKFLLSHDQVLVEVNRRVLVDLIEVKGAELSPGLQWLLGQIRVQFWF